MKTSNHIMTTYLIFLFGFYVGHDIYELLNTYFRKKNIKEIRILVSTYSGQLWQTNSYALLDIVFLMQFTNKKKNE